MHVGGLTRSIALKLGNKPAAGASGASFSEALDGGKSGRRKTEKAVWSKAVSSSSQDELLKARMSYHPGATRAPASTGAQQETQGKHTQADSALGAARKSYT